MRQFEDSFARQNLFAAAAAADERIRFIRNTYLHLAGAVLLFVLIEFAVFAIWGDQLGQILAPVLGSQFGWLLLLGGFMLVSFVADRWARSGASRATQYAGLGLYVVAEALIFVPLLWMATRHEGAIQSAGITTVVIFGGLSAAVFITRIDFSFLRYGLMIAGFGALALILCSWLVGINLGIWFTIAMVMLASGYIVYNTSNVLHQYRTDQHVAASLALFASVALLFWYLLQLFMSRD